MSEIVSECGMFPPDVEHGPDPMTYDKAWGEGQVLALARSIAAETALDRMPILADALEEAGCNNRILLRHCRECTKHVTDCWALSLVLTNASVVERKTSMMSRRAERREREVEEDRAKSTSGWYVAIALLLVLWQATRWSPKTPQETPFTDPTSLEQTDQSTRSNEVEAILREYHKHHPQTTPSTLRTPTSAPTARREK